tara:strand:+ start:34603 stop:35136 length:534 start_codon:yes stop_codon:yes gene_type:complete
MTAKRAKEIEDLRNGILSSEDVLVQKALTKVETKGDASLIPDLISLWSGSDEQKTKQRVESILFGLKNKQALQLLVDYIQTDAADEKKWLALNAIWQSGMDASEHLTALIDFAIANSYTNAIDVMTIIENSEFDITVEPLVDENLVRLNEYLLKHKSDNIDILLQIKSILIDKKIEG